MEEIIKMFALDVFMGQQDRYFNNMIFSSDEMGNIHLANLYDFEISLKSTYIDSDFIYKNANDKAEVHIRPCKKYADIVLSGSAERIKYKNFLNKIIGVIQ